MAKVKDGGQQSFEDKVLMDGELAEACESLMATKEAASDHRKANATIKAKLPGVAEPTRFLVNEQFFIEITPYSVEGHEVGGGDRQRIRVREATSETS